MGSCAAFAGVSYATVDRPLVQKTVIDDPTLPALDVLGVKLHLQTFGDPTRPTLIALHGGPGNDHRHLLPLKPLSDEYHLVFYDQRGAGLSERAKSEDISLEHLVEELDAIAQKFSPDDPVRLVGHSWGAMLAGAYIERHPERVDRAVLLEPGFFDQESADYFLSAIGGGVPPFSLPLLGTLWRRGFEALKVDGPDEDASLDYFGLSLAVSDIPGNPIAGYFCGGKMNEELLHNWRMGVRSSFAIQSAGFDRNRQLLVEFVEKNARSFENPVLLVGTSCNTIIGHDYQKRHVHRFGNARLERLEGAGHMMIEEKPDEVLALLREFLREEPKPRRERDSID